MSNTAETAQRFASIEKPWLHVLPEGASEKEVPKCSMYKFLKDRSQPNLSVNAISYFGEKITYGTFLSKIDQYAAAFDSLGVKKGEYVSLISVVIPETAYTIYALNKIGAICNIIDPRTDTAHIVEYVKKGQSKKLVIVDAVFNKIAKCLDSMDLDTIIVQSPAESLSWIKKLAYKDTAVVDYGDKRVIKSVDFAKLGLGKSVEATEYEPDYPAVVTRTGGTTGVAKGVVLTNDSLNAVVCNVEDFGAIKKPGEKLLNFLPVAASYGIACGIHVAFGFNFENILIPNFQPELFPEYVLKYKPNHIVGVPMFFESLMDNKKAQKADLSFLHTMVSGGDSARPEFEKRFNEFALSRGALYPMAQGYGMSETSSVVTFNMHNIHREGTVGIPSPHTMLSIFKPGTYEELPIGEVGEIYIGGATLMKEYLGEPEETANALFIHPDGSKWVHSGDLGVMDEDGFVKIVGRIKRSIIRYDGHKVYPIQLENAALADERVANCAVIPVVDLDHNQGHLPLVICELRPDVEDKGQVLKEVLELVKANSELRSHPAGIDGMDQIPITNNGKNDITKLTNKFGKFNYK